MEIRTRLVNYMKGLGDKDLCVAFSGGVDSSVILRAACEAAAANGKKVYAVTFETKLHPKADLPQAQKVAKEAGAIHHVIYVNELDNEEMLNNPVNRCYLCKKYLFQNLLTFAAEKGIDTIMEGNNADDLLIYRPGTQAVKELGVLSPLAELGITKAQVREIAADMGLSCASRPSSPCLATRLPYGTPISFELLARVDAGEQWLKEQGFDVVEHHPVTAETIEEEVAWFAKAIGKNEIPSDGLVLVYDDIAYGQSLGTTAKFPRDSFAFKWADEIRETTLLEIEWSPSRTGLINPVAVFEPVELEGTTVSRASVHNISIMEELELGVGDTIQVYKANMIIPQIAENLTRSGVKDIPTVCPVCGGATKISMENETKTLFCTNPECQAKHVKAFSLFVSRDAMNIEGLSEATLEKFILHGYVKDFTDLFHLDRYEEEIKSMDGFGEKSYQKLLRNIENARKTTLARLIYSLGIPNIGSANAKVICKAFGDDPKRAEEATEEELVEIQGIGGIMAKTYVEYFADPKHREIYCRLLDEVELQKEVVTEDSQKFAGINFVITGSVEHFANRAEVKAEIEKRGGKVTGSVTSKTGYLINNDVNSTSSKNKKARELGVPIISEETLIGMLEQ